MSERNTPDLISPPMYFKYSRTSGDDYIQFLLNKQFTPKAIYGEHVHFDLPSSDEEDYENQNLNLTEKEHIQLYIDSQKVNGIKVIQLWKLNCSL